MSEASEWLLADIGGTFCRFALLGHEASITPLAVFHTSDRRGPLEAIRLATQGRSRAPRGFALGVAAPVVDGRAEMTNAAWRFSARELGAALRAPVLIANDLVATGYGLTTLGGGSLRSIGPCDPRSVGESPDPRVVIGVGTGLGVSIVVPIRHGWIVVPSEGGHVTAAASTLEDVRLLEFARSEHARVSWERLLSGPGLELLARFCAHERSLGPRDRDAAEVVASEEDAACIAARTLFSSLLGSFAGDMTLMSRALGGAHLTGGVIDRLGSRLDEVAFREAFERKGRHAGLLARTPTYHLVEPLTAFRGLAYAVAREELGYTLPGFASTREP